MLEEGGERRELRLVFSLPLSFPPSLPLSLLPSLPPPLPLSLPLPLPLSSPPQAFGIGALEEEDTEDNVYGEEAMTSYHATLAGEGDLDMERKFGWTGGSEGQHISNFNM